MPVKLTTTIKNIEDISNKTNVRIINVFLGYMRSNSSSEDHQNNNLKTLCEINSMKDESIILK
ncbi:MAG: hypothetical protein ACR2IS_18250 [Nitrososphaeraceae archaeon]